VKNALNVVGRLDEIREEALRYNLGNAAALLGVAVRFPVGIYGPILALAQPM